MRRSTARVLNSREARGRAGGVAYVLVLDHQRRARRRGPELAAEPVCRWRPQLHYERRLDARLLDGVRHVCVDHRLRHRWQPARAHEGAACRPHRQPRRLLPLSPRHGTTSRELRGNSC